MDLFVYGTLMDPELFHTLTGKPINAEPARLLGCRYFRNPNSYAYILACAGERVDGLLLHDIDDQALRALDHYEAEGDLYFRISVVAETSGGPCPCETYVGNPSAIGRLEVS